MNPDTGELYASLDEAKQAGVEDPVELIGSAEAVHSISDAVKEARRRKNKAAKKARRANRA